MEELVLQFYFPNMKLCKSIFIFILFSYNYIIYFLIFYIPTALSPSSPLPVSPPTSLSSRSTLRQKKSSLSKDIEQAEHNMP